MMKLYVASLVKKFSSVFFGVISTIALNRALGTSLRGEYAIMENGLALVVIVAHFGLSNVLPYFLREVGEEVVGSFASLFAWQFWLLLTGGMIFVATRESLLAGVMVLAGAASVYSTQLVQYSLIINFKATVVATIVGNLVNMILLVAMFVTNSGSVLVAFAIYAAKEIVLLTICAFMTSTSVLPRALRVDLLARVYRAAFLPMIINLLTVANYRTPVLIMGLMMIPIHDVGLYAVGVGLAQYLWLIPDVFKDVVTNFTARKDNVASVARALRFASAGVLLMLVFLTIFGQTVLHIMYGAEFVPAYLNMMLISGGVWGIVYVKLLGVLWLANGRWLYYVFVMLLSLGVTLGAGIPLSRVFGPAGFAAAASLSYLAAGLVFASAFSKRFRVPISQIVFPRPSEVVQVSSNLKRLISRNPDG